MTLKEAEEIVHKYGTVLADSEFKNARNKEELPCSEARIKLAFYLSLEHLIKNGEFTDKDSEMFVLTYSYLGDFVEKKLALSVKNHFDEIERGKMPANSKEVIRFMENSAKSFKRLSGEIIDFIDECMKR